MKVGNSSIHSLLDSGCQANFLRDDLVTKLNLEIVKQRVPLSINGVNSKKTYVMKEVILPIEISGKKQELRCFSIPEIGINMQVPGIQELAQNATEIGLSLADNTLLDCINDKVTDFDLIIGVNDFAKLVIETCFIGNICMWKSGEQIIFLGNIEEVAEEINIIYSNICPSDDE